MKRAIIITLVFVTFAIAANAQDYTFLNPPSVAVADFEVSMSAADKEASKQFYGQLISQALLTMLVQQNAASVVYAPRDGRSMAGIPVYTPDFNVNPAFLAIDSAVVRAWTDSVQKAAEAYGKAKDDKARADAFTTRMFAGDPGKKAYACFVRHYDADHLARHPKQKVAAMKLLVEAEYENEDKSLHYSFRLGVKYRHRSGDFDSSGSCSHVLAQENNNEVRFGCGVDCDGGGIDVALSNDDKSAIIRLESIRIWQNNKPDDDAEHALVAGADDKIFRLDRSDNRDCSSLVTDRKELAALRRK